MHVPAKDGDGYRYYGKWTGNSRGVREKTDRCIAEIAHNWDRVQCSRKRGHGPNAEFCLQHAKKVEANT